MDGFESLFSLIKNIFAFLIGATGYGISLWFLATVLVWSSIVKLRRPKLAAMAMVDFNVVSTVYPILGWLLGVVELSLAIALVLQIFPRLTFLVTALLLWFFSILIARSLWLDETFSCFCFGDADSELSRWTLVRTIALAILATIMVLVAVPIDQYLSFQIATLQATIAWSFLGTIVLGSYVLLLLRWGISPFNKEVN